MTWRDNLRKVTMTDGRVLIGASFRGVPFFVESADRSGGRRLVTHEFPLRDLPTIEDMGRRAARFAVEGYVLGDDYTAQRDALRSALEDVSGPGDLVHPYYGTLRVLCESMTIRETKADGGMARFALDFAEAPLAVTAPTEAPSLDADVAIAADAVDAALLLELEDSYQVDDVPAFALESIAGDLTSLSTGLYARFADVVRSEQELAALNATLQTIIGTSISLVREPAQAIEAMRTLLNNIATTAANAPGRIYRAIIATYDDVLVVFSEGTTATRQLERANQQAMGDALRLSLMVSAALVLLDVEHVSIDEAVDDRDALVAALDTLALTAGNETYPTILQLRSAVLLAVPGDARLARVVTVERRTSLPALLLAYQLYGSVELEQDIVDRNAAQHPGFMVGELKVLSNA